MMCWCVSTDEFKVPSLRWYKGDTLLAEGQRVEVLLSVGLYDLRLEVESDGKTASDDALVRVY